MPTVVPVRFAYAMRDLWFDAQGLDVAEGDHLICSTERGTEIGLATADTREVDRSELRSLVGDATLKPVVRVADDEDLDRADLLAEQGERALPVFRRLVAASGLDMKPVGVEYLFGGERVVCYFSAEERVDFRSLVRQLAGELHERIDMRQIGVREEAAHVGGFAHCGQELCCARFGRQFEPVSIRMAKEQDLPLNSTKISGACGRLMCCLRYEFEAYRDFKGRAPKRNAVIETPLGKAKIVEYDTPKEQVALRLENGKLVRVALADMVASEAAVRKSEELHCPCRPDTVTRAALERFASPEVQLALAELDREAGLDEGSYDASDLFVEPKGKSRRRRSRSRQGASGGEEADERRRTQDAAKGAAAKGTEEPTRTRRRRRKRATDAQGEGTPAAPNDGARSSRAAAGTDAQESSGAQRPRRRRRHHASEDAQGSEARRERASAAQAGEPAGNSAPPRRRRPGDHGGQAAAGGQAKGAPAPGQSSSGEASGAGAATGEGKRRRRRRSRGRGKGTSGGEAASSSPQG